MSTPLHPLLVHFPIVLTFCLPVLLFIFWIAERKGWVSQKIWWIAFTLSLANPLTSFLALRTGEQDEDLVEKFVSENLIEAHEEWGELVLWMGIGVCALLLAQVLFKRFNFLKVLTFLFALAAVFPVIQAGHTGGELVYKHGAAQAHIQKTPATPLLPKSITIRIPKNKSVLTDFPSTRCRGWKKAIFFEFSKKIELMIRIIPISFYFD